MPRVLFLALALLPGPLQAPAPLLLEIRIFDGAVEVSAETRVTVHRSGERSSPIARITPSDGRLEIEVPPGIYDVQAIREQDGRVVNIRWAERLVVMPYPDEGGRHLEVVNFKNGFGALQVRDKDGSGIPDVGVHADGARDKDGAARQTGAGYALFVVPAGRYDIVTRTGGRSAWHAGIEVPLDGTRLWLVPSGGQTTFLPVRSRYATTASATTSRM